MIILCLLSAPCMYLDENNFLRILFDDVCDLENIRFAPSYFRWKTLRIYLFHYVVWYALRQVYKHYFWKLGIHMTFCYQKLLFLSRTSWFYGMALYHLLIFFHYALFINVVVRTPKIPDKDSLRRRILVLKLFRSWQIDLEVYLTKIYLKIQINLH